MEDAEADIAAVFVMVSVTIAVIVAAIVNQSVVYNKSFEYDEIQ